MSQRALAGDTKGQAQFGLIYAKEGNGIRQLYTRLNEIRALPKAHDLQGPFPFICHGFFFQA